MAVSPSGNSQLGKTQPVAIAANASTALSTASKQKVPEMNTQHSVIVTHPDLSQTLTRITVWADGSVTHEVDTRHGPYATWQPVRQGVEYREENF